MTSTGPVSYRDPCATRAERIFDAIHAATDLNTDDEINPVVAEVLRAVARDVPDELRDWADLIRFKRELISDADLIDSTVELVERRADELERGTP